MGSNRGRKAGRHFLQIPGPTPVPDRILRAMDMPVIDHRGPEFEELGLRCLDGMKRIFKTKIRRHLSLVRDRRLGGGALQRAFAWRPRHHVRDRTIRRPVARRLPSALGSRSISLPPTGAPASIPKSSRRSSPPTKRTRSKPSASCTTRPRPARPARIDEVRAALDAARHPALLLVDTISSLGSIDYRHDEWRVDVTVGGSQKGLMLPPGLSFNAISAEGACRVEDVEAAALLLGLGRDDRRSMKAAFSPTRRRRTCSTASPRRSTCCRGRPRQRVRASLPARRGDAPRCRRVGPRDSVPRCRRAYSAVLTGVIVPDGHDADAFRKTRAGALRHVARHGLRQGRRQGVPHRPSRRHQRSDRCSARLPAWRWGWRSPACRIRRAASMQRWIG